MTFHEELNQIRRRAGLAEAPLDVGIEARRKGHYVEIDTMWLPPEHRRAGHGRAYYQKWEEKLPPDVEFVRLMPVDFGAGPPDQFWIKMGFQYLHDGSKWMVKGVNGFETPTQ